jgi:DNA-binding MarR family transcriptional regulator
MFSVLVAIPFSKTMDLLTSESIRLTKYFSNSEVSEEFHQKTFVRCPDCFERSEHDGACGMKSKEEQRGQTEEIDQPTGGRLFANQEGLPGSSAVALAADLSVLMATLRALHGERMGLPSSVLFDLTMAQFRTMVVLLSTGGAPSRVLAERLKIGASAVTPLVDKLVEQNLARREDDPTDRRISWIRPTEKAQTLYAELTNINEEVMSDLVSDLSVEEIAHVQKGFAIFAAAAKRKLEALRKPVVSSQ